MDTATEVYEQLRKEAVRLSTKEELLSIEDILRDYIIPEVTVKQQIELARLLQEKKPEKLQGILDDIRAAREAIKILALMEASDNIEEFKKLASKKGKRKKKEEKPYELTDFDKFVKAIASVPKPSPEELKKYIKKNKPK